MSGCVTDRSRQLLATYWYDDRLNYEFTDPDIAKHYRGVCSFFANECNVALKGVSADHNRFIFYVSGPRHAGSFWVYDRRASKLDPLGAAYTGLARAPLARMDVVNVISRDGLRVTAYLTTPTGSSPTKRPLVVMPHGGPEARDTLAFDPLVQAFAQQGWMVLQVNFRGSGGYGRKFTNAGRKHWSDLMQNDIEDAVKGVHDRGVIDESRIAICGISYGGYAALMGAVKTPDVYKAVVSIAGVSDLPKMLAFVRERDGASSLTYNYWRDTIGDPTDDRKALLAGSPALRAGEIRAPVLLMHGDLDPIVGVEQSRTMSRALKGAHRVVDYVEVSVEGHPNWRSENHVMMVRRSIEHIQKAFEQVPA
jgi:dipeptidyl aminopeptidase/acylaminoacyl peptidase